MSDNMNKKKCPFNMKPCMEDECVFFEEDICECEFKGSIQYIGERFEDLFDTIRDNREDSDD